MVLKRSAIPLLLSKIATIPVSSNDKRSLNKSPCALKRIIGQVRHHLVQFLCSLNSVHHGH